MDYVIFNVRTCSFPAVFFRVCGLGSFVGCVLCVQCSAVSRVRETLSEPVTLTSTFQSQEQCPTSNNLSGSMQLVWRVSVFCVSKRARVCVIWFPPRIPPPPPPNHHVPLRKAPGISFKNWSYENTMKGGRRFLMSPPCLESQRLQFDPTFLYLLCCSSA